MFLLFYCLPTILVIISLPFLIWFLPKRYGRLTTVKILGCVFSLSLLIGGVASTITGREIKKMYGGIQWKYLVSVEGSKASFEYRPGVGLYTIENGDEIQITGKWPFCGSEGIITELEPEKVFASTNTANILPRPPQDEQARIDFIFTYATEKDIAYSSFVTFKNGEVWCAERHFHGMADIGDISMGIGLSMIAYLFIDMWICTGSFVVVFVIVISGIEIRRRRVRNFPA